MYKRRNMRGGNANVRPAEYYGGNSGNYFETVPPVGGSAYGQIHPVSHGVIHGSVAGPNLAVYPNGGSVQTGGGKKCGGSGTRRSRAKGGSARRANRTRRAKRGCGNGTHHKSRSRSRGVRSRRSRSSRRRSRQ